MRLTLWAVEELSLWLGRDRGGLKGATGWALHRGCPLRGLDLLVFAGPSLRSSAERDILPSHRLSPPPRMLSPAPPSDLPDPELGAREGQMVAKPLFPSSQGAAVGASLLVARPTLALCSRRCDAVAGRLLTRVLTRVPSSRSYDGESHKGTTMCIDC